MNLGKEPKIEIKKLSEILKEDVLLKIPYYQRPYKWSDKNISELLIDIDSAIDEQSKNGKDFTYRVGTIILNEDGEYYDIVDGQQRIISLVLLRKYLDNNFKCSILEHRFSNKITIKNINQNYKFISNWFEYRKDRVESFKRAYEDLLEVVVITVQDISEAFQLFDSQNTRGKALYPHDLLKAYHLREMEELTVVEKENEVKIWEDTSSHDIENLFNDYLFPIMSWSKKEKAKAFTINEIDTYKGISLKYNYSYAERAYFASPRFQITEVFISGKDFFKMVQHYLVLKENMIKELNKYEEIQGILKENKNSLGFNHAKRLFYAALLAYYDKFNNLDEIVIKKLFIWAFMLRVNMRNLGFDSINNYAIGEKNGRYTNAIPIFERIKSARLHTEIENIPIEFIKDDNQKSTNWKELYDKLQELM